MNARAVCETSIDQSGGLEHSERQIGVDMDGDNQMDIDILIWRHIMDLGVGMGHDMYGMLLTIWILIGRSMSHFTYVYMCYDIDKDTSIDTHME